MGGDEPVGDGRAPDAGTAGGSLGVEEEFLLVDAASGECVGRAEEVLRAAGPHRWAGTGGSFQGELLASQVEATTGVCHDLAGLRAQLRYGRARLAEAARECGALLVSAGTPVLGGPAPPVARGSGSARSWWPTGRWCATTRRAGAMSTSGSRTGTPRWRW
ncbi:glutamate-cysteine ligase family protein [Actinomadura madurae]|nr:glutamate-cysteine ligase family protein [Actinomadura madurae]URM93351.1 glutamate-cysteine ligase family protein [Actinomadura madurae]